MRGRAVLVVVCLLLAGCSTSLPGDPTDLDGATTPEPTEWDGDPENHFRERELTVAVRNDAIPERDYRPLVREALDYWEAESERYAGFPIAYRIAEDEDPDVVVRFVPTIEECGSEDHAAGCAPILTEPGQVNRPVTVRVRGNFSDASTVEVLKHELGHTLGIRHGEPPEAVMQASSNLTSLPQPDARNRTMPWGKPGLFVHVDYGAVPARDRPETREQVNAALGYFGDGANGTVPENVTFYRAETAEEADIVVRFAENAPCTQGSGSCGNLRGTDPDGDGQIERYTALTITLSGIDTEATAWHVGYWLGRGFGLSGEELPPPLASDDPDVRRSEWWT
ncbi:matrixin family metalloprotease [Natronomonas sp. EA1]|uniref:matrixin family metalloprotease n=1 Tax=Natronomonas sp. EA1 TaxID=3421655 RepID=UPI003EB77408